MPVINIKECKMSLIISHIYASLNIFDFSVMDSQFYYLDHPSIEGGLEAWAHSLINGRILVLKGSGFRKIAVDSCPRNARSKRDKIRREGNTLIEFNDSLIFNRDYSFDTKNEAGQVISGNSSNSSQNWEEITDKQRWQALNRTRQTRIGEINKARKKQKGTSKNCRPPLWQSWLVHMKPAPGLTFSW